MAKKNKNKITYAISRRSKTGIFALCLLFVSVIIWLDHTSLAPSRQKQPPTDAGLKTADFNKYHNKRFSVINVVDGDTIDINVPDGKFGRTRIRLWGVDTPETKHPKTGLMYFGPEAAEFTENLTLGKMVTIYLDPANRSRGKYGRLLAYVKLPDANFLNETLLREGFAYADLRFRHSFYSKYKQLESVARSQKKGLWGNVTREQLPEWLQRKKPRLLNK